MCCQKGPPLSSPFLSNTLRALQKNTQNGPPSQPSPSNTTPTTNFATQPSGTKNPPPKNGPPPVTPNGKNHPSPTNLSTTMRNPINSTLKSRRWDRFRPTRLFIRG